LQNLTNDKLAQFESQKVLPSKNWYSKAFKILLNNKLVYHDLQTKLINTKLALHDFKKKLTIGFVAKSALQHA
jgi:hypothetical protein